MARRIRAFYRLLLAGVILLSLAAARSSAADRPAGHQPAGHQPAAYGWQVTCVDCPKTFDAWTDRSLRLTSAGRPAVAYGGDHLYYAWHDGATWQRAVVDDAPAVGASAALALTTADAARIAYYDAFNRDLKLAQWTPAGWVRQVVDATGDAGASVALALDHAGAPHLAYYRQNDDGTGKALRHARWTGAQWELATVAEVTSTVRFIALALDGADRPHISYYDEWDQDLRYARWTGSAWEVFTVDSEGDLGAGSSLALDAGGQPHISYYDYDSVRGALRYATWDGVAGHAWAIHVADDDADDVGGYTSLALDRAGRPVISYRDFTNGDLKLARWPAAAGDGDVQAAGWLTETVDAAGDVGAYTSLALDGTDQPRIVYFDLTNNALRYAAWQGGAWQLSELDRAGRVGDYTALAFDAAGAPHISYHDGDRDQLKYATQNAGTWYNTVVDAQAGVGLHTSLALDGAGRPHISYQDGRELDLRYARWDGAGWEIVAVDTAGDVGASTAIGVDRAGWPHISYYDATNQAVKYAVRSAAGWVIEQVAEIGPLTYTSLALDAAGAPHIAFYASSADGSSGELGYASRTAAGVWQIKMVNSSVDAGGHVSLALDAHDVPVISYYDFATPRVWVAYHASEGWVTQVVAVTGGESHTALTLDRAGMPLVAFYDSAAADLKIARPVNAAAGAAGARPAGWVVTTVYQGGDVGAYPSLRLDTAGRPWISFYDVKNGDLLVAKGAGGANTVFLPLLLRAAR
jgi:hypothetical protein